MTQGLGGRGYEEKSVVEVEWKIQNRMSGFAGIDPFVMYTTREIFRLIFLSTVIMLI